MKVVKKKDRIIWEGSRYKFVWKNIHADDACPFKEIPNDEAPEYLWYKFAFYKRKNKKWKKLAGTFVGDFPMIEPFANIISMALDDRDLSKFQHETVEYNGEKYEYYCRTLSASSFFSADAYSIIQDGIIDEEGGPDWSGEKFFVTMGVNRQGNAAENVTIMATRKEMKELLDLAESVIIKGREGFNANVREYIKENSSNKYIREGRLYQEAGTIETNQNLYMEGQHGSLYALGKEEEGYFCNGKQAVILKIDDDSGKVTFRTKEFGKEEEIELLPSEIMDFLADNTSSPRIFMDEAGIEKDFMENIMTPAIRQDFLTMTVKQLDEKYADRILNMYWMCRDEHLFAAGWGDGRPGRTMTVATKIVHSIRRKVRRQSGRT